MDGVLGQDPNNGLKPALGYRRVSKLMGREDDLISDAIQERKVVQAARRDGYYIVEWLDDLGETGRSFHKRKVKDIIKKVTDKVADRVYIAYWSRWGRNARESLKYILMVEKAGARVSSVLEPFDETTAFGKRGRNQALVDAEYQSDVIGEGWKSAHEERRDRGLPHHGRPMWGYIYEARLIEDPNDLDYGKQKRRYYVDEGLRAIVREAYERYVHRRQGFPAIAKWLNEIGALTVTGNTWTDTTIRQVMDNPFAAGVIRERSVIPRDEYGFAIPTMEAGRYDKKRKGCHEAIVPQALWDAYEKRRAQRDKAPTSETPRFSLSTLVRCGRCSGPMSVVWSNYDSVGGPFGYWKCRRSRARDIHPPLSIPMAEVMETVRLWIIEQAEGTARRSVEDEAERIRALRRASGNAARYEKELADLGKQWGNIVDGVTLGLFEANDPAVARNKDRILRETAEAQRRLEQARAAERVLGEADRRVEAFGTLADGWADHIRVPASHNGALSELILGAFVFPRSAGVRVRVAGRWEFGDEVEARDAFMSQTSA